MKHLFYRLDESGEPMPCDNPFEYADQLRDLEKRRVAVTYFKDQTIEVSTVFTGLNQSWDADPPILWETMIFAKDDPQVGDLHHYRRRYRSREEALQGHKDTCAYLQAQIKMH